MDLLKDNIPRLVRKLAVPAMVGTLFQTLYNVVDTFFAGKISPEALSALSKSFADQNTVIYGVSRDSIASHEKFMQKFNYTIDLISDEDESLCNQFDVSKLNKLYGKEYLGIVRSTFVITPNGEILKHWAKVKLDGHAEEVLAFIKGL